MSGNCRAIVRQLEGAFSPARSAAMAHSVQVWLDGSDAIFV